MTAPAKSFPIRSSEQEALALLAEGRLEEAEGLARSLLASGTGPVRLWKLLAAALRQQGRFEETRAIQSMLVEAMPGNLELRFDFAETLLMLGDFDRGWREYRHRYSLPNTVRIERKVQVPRWDGRPLPGQTLLIHDEQGYGDTFQFLRLVRKAKERSGAKIILEINQESLSFAQRTSEADIICPPGQLLSSFNVHCELMSLPMALGLKMVDLPGPMPYLNADPNRLEYWRKRLADLPRPLVGLVWAASPFPHPKRSMPLSALAPLAMEGVTFLSIQKGPKAAEGKNPPQGMHLVDLSDEIANFDDTAAILCIADLLISIDSAPVHLAGALGRPAWVMLLNVADWRWLEKREDSPWYPSLRLFRQPERDDDWGKVTNRVAAELQCWLNRKK